MKYKKFKIPMENPDCGILQSHQVNKDQNRGLPIGSLSSQYFANYYLDGLDRLLNNDIQVRKSLRYMDDFFDY